MKQEELRAAKGRAVAVILAGGSGQRAGAGTPKQYLEIAGRMVIERAVDAFELHRGVDEITIVAREEELARTRAIVEKNGWRKVTNIAAGGKERHDSCLAAIRLHDDPRTRLLLHDAARPLVSRRVIDAVLEALEEDEAVVPAVPVVDTILRARDGLVEDAPDRSALVQAQTPQAFRLGTIREAYARALADPAFHATDDCGVVRRYLPGTRVRVVPGEAANMKLTYAWDALLLERFLAGE